MPAAQVELHHRNEALLGIVFFGHGQQGFRVLHKAVQRYYTIHISYLSRGKGRRGVGTTDFVIRSSMLLGSKIKVGRVMRLRSAPGRNCEIIDMSTESFFIFLFFSKVSNRKYAQKRSKRSRR